MTEINVNQSSYPALSRQQSVESTIAEALSASKYSPITPAPKSDVPPPDDGIEIKAEESKNRDVKHSITLVDDPEYRHDPHTKTFYTNGIQTGYAEGMTATKTLANQLNAPVHYFSNPTKGFSDVGETFFQANKIEKVHPIFDFFGVDFKEMGWDTDLSEKFAQTIYESLVIEGQNVNIHAHSQGAANTAFALDKLKNMLQTDGRSEQEIKAILGRVSVMTYGGFAVEADYPEEINYKGEAHPLDTFPILAMGQYATKKGWEWGSAAGEAVGKVVGLVSGAYIGGAIGVAAGTAAGTAMGGPVGGTIGAATVGFAGSMAGGYIGKETAGTVGKYVGGVMGAAVPALLTVGAGTLMLGYNALQFVGSAIGIAAADLTVGTKGANTSSTFDYLKDLGSRAFNAMKEEHTVFDTENEGYLQRAEVNEHIDKEAVASSRRAEDRNVLLQHVLSNPTLPESYLAVLSNHTDYEVREQVARHPNASEETLYLLAMDSNIGVKSAALSNQNTPFETVLSAYSDFEELQLEYNSLKEELSPQEFFDIKGESLAYDIQLLASGLVQNPHLPMNILETLYQNASRDLKLNFAQNPNLPEQVFADLIYINDSDINVRLSINPGLPLDAQLRLVESKDPYVLWGLIGNEAVAGEVLVQLSETLPPEQYLSTILSHPNFPKELVNDYVIQHSLLAFIGIAGSPHTSTEVLFQIAQDNPEHLDVMRSLASNPSAPPELLERLANHEDFKVKANVAGNPNASEQTIIKLAQSEAIYPAAQKAALQHPKLPVEHLEAHILQNVHNPSLQIQYLASMDQDMSARLISEMLKNEKLSLTMQTYLAGHHALSLDDQEKLLASPSPQVRQALANNFYIEPEIVNQLAEDKQFFVRATAASHLKISPQQLEKLLNDPRDEVKAVANQYKSAQ